MPRILKYPYDGRLWLAVVVVAGVAAIIGALIWRTQGLVELPDLGEPFDVAEALRPVAIPDNENAYVAYAAARQKLVKPANPINDARREFLDVAAWKADIKALTWATAAEGSRAYLEDKRPALEIWREGSRLRDALYHQPNRIALDSPLNLLEDARTLAALAALEGSRLEGAGVKDGARGWYLAILRSSRLVGRHGSLVQRVYGAKIHALAARCILRWAADPGVDAGLLRRALAETLAADALTSPLSDAIKIDYLICQWDLADLGHFENTLREFGRRLPLLGEGALDQFVLSPVVRNSAQRFRLIATNDVERSRRAIQLLFANWLAQADRPAAGRAPLAIQEPTWIYVDDPSAPPAARAVKPDVLRRAIGQTTIARFFFGSEFMQGGPPWERDGVLARERRGRSVLIVRLAAELYRREHGASPASTGALVGPYLEELPGGIDSGDAIPKAVE
jgi:hypothetical protein